MTTTLLLIAGVTWGFLNKQLLKDKYVVHTSEVQAAAAAIMPSLKLTPSGEFLYQASLPELQDAIRFNKSCGGVKKEQSIVLGCYTLQRFYVYNVTDSRLSGAKQVTAAHELLHAAYERLSSTEKAALNKNLRNAAASIQDERFIDTMNAYKRTEPNQLENELHSILGTEIAVLPDVLERHYKKFFNDRSVIVGYAQEYASTFKQIETKIQTFDAQLESLLTQKNQIENSLGEQKKTIETQKAQLAQLRSSNVAEYNSMVPAYNQNIRLYNSLVEQLKGIVVQYNQIVNERNELAATQNDLVKKLDSTYKEIQ